MARRAKVEPPPEAGAPMWALSFGDLMSQLLVFFILLFSVSEMKEKKIFDVLQSFRTYFRIDAPMSGYTMRSLEESFEALAAIAFRAPDQQGQMGQSDIMVDTRLGKFLQVEEKDESVRLTIAAEVLFKDLETVLSPEALEHLALVADKLAGYWTRIKVLGHTSPLPLPPNAPYADHMALGYARAKTVADALVGQWQKTGRPEEASRLEVASRGRQDPPRDWTDEGKYDRVEIIVTAEPVLRRNTLKRLGQAEEPVVEAPAEERG